MKQQSNEVINRALATFVGLCWHDLVLGSDDVWRCNEIDCPLEMQNYGGIHGDPKGNPDYCSSDSPRSLLEGVVAKVGPRLNPYLFKLAVEDCMENIDRNTRFGCVSLTAEQIARACYACINEKEK